MTATLDRLLDNLKAQQEAMIADNIEQILMIVDEQEQLLARVQEEVSMAPVLGNDDRTKLAKVRELVEINQLLAQQSLAFSRKIVKALCEDVDYSESGTPSLRPGQSLDVRA